MRELMTAYTDQNEQDNAPHRRLLAVLLEQLRGAPERPLHLPVPHDDRLRAVMDLINSRPAEPHSLKTLATAVGASARTMTRLCRAELGMTVPQWRTQLRLHHALELLAEEIPVSTVAARCGWASTSAFIDVFRRNLGHTPGKHLGAAPGS